MLTKEQYEDAQRLLQSYMAVNPAPGSRYAQRIEELRMLVEQHERAAPLTHQDIQARVNRKRGRA